MASMRPGGTHCGLTGFCFSWAAFFRLEYACAALAYAFRPTGISMLASSRWMLLKFVDQEDSDAFSTRSADLERKGEASTWVVGAVLLLLKQHDAFPRASFAA